MTDIKTGITNETDRKTLENLRSLLVEVSGWRNGISVQSLAYLIDIMLNEGTTATDLAERCGAERTAVSKQLSTFTNSSKNLTSGGGLGLIAAVQDPTHWRQKNLRLTAKGRRSVSRLFENILEDKPYEHKEKG